MSGDQRLHLAVLRHEQQVLLARGAVPPPAPRPWWQRLLRRIGWWITHR